MCKGFLICLAHRFSLLNIIFDFRFSNLTMKSGIYTAILLAVFPPVMTEAIEGTSLAAKSKTYVVNLEFCCSCLNEEEAEYKYSYKEVNTFAELKYDLLANLPVAYTICFSLMTTYGTTKILLNSLGKDGNSWLEPLLAVHSFNILSCQVA